MIPPPTFRTAAVGYLALAGLALLLYWWPQAKLLAGDEGHYHATALAILGGGDWFDRNLIWPPLQGVFLAAIYAVVGPHVLAVQLLQLVLLAVAGRLLYRLVLELTGDEATAGWAGVLLAVNPLTIGFATYLWPEITHLVLSLLLAWALLRARTAGEPAASVGTHGRAVAWSALAGVALGLCLLAKSLLAAFWPLLLLPLLRPGHWRTSLLRAAVFGLAAIVTTAPALYRGWQQTGRPMIADSSWFNLWVGLQDRWRGDLVLDQTGQRLAEYLASADDHAGRTAFAREQASTIVAEQGLLPTLAAQLSRQYFRLFDARNFVVAQLSGENCAGYLSRYRLSHPGLIAGIDVALRAWHLALLALCAFGLAAWRGWRRPWLWLVAAFVGYQLALLGMLHVKTRFLLPMLPVLCLFAGYALASAGTIRTRWPPLRVAIGVALAALMLALATLGPVLDRACG